VKKILNRIGEVIKTSDALAYVKSLSLCEDVDTLVEKGKFPFINLEGETISIQGIDDFDNDAERETYKITIQFACKNPVKKVCVLGTADCKGVWDIAHDIYTAIKNHINAVRNTGDELTLAKRPVIQQRTWVMQDAKYMAGAEMTIELSRDIFA
jgi:hypothetical protein